MSMIDDLVVASSCSLPSLYFFCSSPVNVSTMITKENIFDVALQMHPSEVSSNGLSRLNFFTLKVMFNVKETSATRHINNTSFDGPYIETTVRTVMISSASYWNFVCSKVSPLESCWLI